MLVADGDMTLKQRDTAAGEMTDEVGELVLRDNYLQTAGDQRRRAPARRARLDGSRPASCGRWRRAGQLDRAIEFLPDDEDDRGPRRAPGRA